MDYTQSTSAGTGSGGSAVEITHNNNSNYQ